MKIKLMEWNINQRGRSSNYIPDCIVDQIEEDINIIILTEFNNNAKNVKEFKSKLVSKGFQYVTTNYTIQEYANDILIAIKSTKNANIEIEDFEWKHAYSSDLNFNELSEIPENLCVKLSICNRKVNLWGVRIKELKSDYVGRLHQMLNLMSWINPREINILAGDFNNLRENTQVSSWSLQILDEILDDKYVRITPENHSWGVSQKCDGTFDGYIKNDHLIHSKCNEIQNVKVEKYNWDFLDIDVNCKLKEESSRIHIENGIPDHGILRVEMEIK